MRCNTKIIVKHINGDAEKLDAVLECWVDCQVADGHTLMEILDGLSNLQMDYDPLRFRQVYGLLRKYIQKVWELNKFQSLYV